MAKGMVGRFAHEDEALRKMPEDPTSPKTYDQQLQEAAESGKYRRKEPDKGIDR